MFYPQSCTEDNHNKLYQLKKYKQSPHLLKFNFNKLTIGWGRTKAIDSVEHLILNDFSSFSRPVVNLRMRILIQQSELICVNSNKPMISHTIQHSEIIPMLYNAYYEILGSSQMSWVQVLNIPGWTFAATTHWIKSSLSPSKKSHSQNGIWPWLQLAY